MPPKVSKKSGKKAGKNTRQGGKKKRPKEKYSYDTLILRILQDLWPDKEISSEAMALTNRFLDDIYRRISVEVVELSHLSKQKTVTCHLMESAVRLAFPGHLAESAVVKGEQAVDDYVEYCSK